MNIENLYQAIYNDYNKFSKGLEKEPTIEVVIWNFMFSKRYPKNIKILKELIEYVSNSRNNKQGN